MAGARYLAGAAYVQVLPSLRGFQKQIGRDLKAIDVRATARVVPQVDKAAADKAAEDVQALTNKLVKAREKEADAAGKVRVAEQQLKEVRDKGRASASQILAAEERLATAQRNLASAQRITASTTARLDQAQAAAADRLKVFTAESNRSQRSILRLVSAIDRVDTSRFESGVRSLAKFSGASVQAASATVAIGSAAPAVASLAAALAQAGGAAAALPGVLSTGGIALGVLKLGLSGLSDALSEWDDPEKFAEAIAKLGTEGRRLAVTIRDLMPQFLGLRNSVQNSILAGSAADVRLLTKVYLPLLRSGLTAVGDQFGRTRRELVKFVTTGQTVSDIGSLMFSAETATFNLTGAVVPLASAFRDLSVVGAESFAGLTGGAAEAAKGFATFIAEARASGQIESWIDTGMTVLSQFGQLVLLVGDIIGTVFSAANAQGGGLLDTLINLTSGVLDMLRSAQGQTALAAFFAAVRGVVQALLPGLQAVGSAVLDGIIKLGPHLPPVAGAFSAVAVAVAPLIPQLVSLVTTLLPPLVSLLTWLAPALPTIAAGFAAGYLALQGYNIVVSVVRWFQMWAAAQWALNAAMSANPIGLIIAGIAALVAGFIYLWNNSESFRGFWIGLWEAIRDAAVWVWENALKPAWDGILIGLQAIGDAASWLWNTVLSPVFNFLSLAARTVAAVLLTVLITPVVIAFNLLAAVATWLWENALKPVFDKIAEIATWLYDNVIKPVVDGIVIYIQRWGAIFSWLWDNAIKPAIDGIAAAANWIWVNVLQPIIDVIVAAVRGWGEIFSWLWNNAIKPALDALGAAFQWVWFQVIKPAWDGLGEGIQWVWDNVIKPVFDFLKSGVDAVAQAFDKGVSWIKQVWDKIKEIAAVPVNFVIDTVYNNGIRKVWNGIADFLGLGKLGEIAPVKFAGGGVLGGYAPGVDVVPALLSPGEAVLVPELVRQIGAANILAANAAASGGRPATVTRGGGGFSGGGIARFAGGGIVDTVLGFVGGIGDAVIGLFRDPITWIKNKLGLGNSQWIDMIARAPGKLIGDAVKWLGDKLNPFSSGGTAAGPAGNAQLTSWIRAAMQFTNTPDTWFPGLITLIMRESGGNPAARNDWDINAQRGIPSQGLMQTIPPTFAAYRDPRLPNNILDPIANIVAGINYIKARYGSIFNVQQANAGAAPRGYAGGGLVFDQGGYLPPGYTNVYNGTGRPERILTDHQWDSLTGRSMEGLSLVGAVVEVRDDGLMHFVDGRIEASQNALFDPRRI